jgi:hypothetical protein
MSRHLMSAAVLAVAVMAAQPRAVFAEVSHNVISAFRGQVVITKDDLPEGKNDKETISKIKAVQLRELTGTKNDDVTFWHFHYTAFLKTTGSTQLTLEFMNGKQLSANQRLEGVDAKSGVLSGDISINEDEGLAAGKTYTVQLVTGKDVVVATTTLTMK